jgi:hypothetical protein
VKLFYRQQFRAPDQSLALDSGQEHRTKSGIADNVVRGLLIAENGRTSEGWAPQRQLQPNGSSRRYPESSVRARPDSDNDLIRSTQFLKNLLHRQRKLSRLRKFSPDQDSARLGNR